MKTAKWLALCLIVVLAVGSAAVVTAKDKCEVAVIRWSPDDIYFNGVQLGQEMERERIEKEKGVKIEFRVFGANDVSKQRDALDAQVARGVDGVLLVPWRGGAMKNVVTQLRKGRDSGGDQQCLGARRQTGICGL